MNTIDISVIVPIYGVEKYIERCLASLFTQTKTDGVEFIFVNDATKDGSMIILNDFISMYPNILVKVVNHELNKGLAASRQSGSDIASGSYIIHLDSDDWCESTMLEDLYNAAILNDVDVVVCDFYRNYRGREIYDKQIVDSDPICLYNSILYGHAAPSIWNKMVRRSVIVNNNIVSIPNINMGEDQIFSAQLLCKANPSIYYLPKAYLHYCIRDNSHITSTNDKYLQDSINGTTIIERLVSEKGLMDRLHDGLLVKKLRVKLRCLLHSSGERQKEYATIYPETNEYIYSHTPAKLPYKIALKQAMSGRVLIFNIIVGTMRFTHKLIR